MTRAMTGSIERAIFVVRGHRVMLDADLAAVYGVTPKRLNEQVRRNAERFPLDFAFRLTPEEYLVLRSQIATLEKGRGKHRKYLPWAFTEHGAVMLANVLRSPRAIRASIEVVRTFVRLRELAVTHKDLARRLDDLEKKYDVQFAVVFDAIRELMEPIEEGPKERIGFHRKDST